MADIGELRRRVEAEPGDHELRWRLAKRLYADSDYREALTHLRILKNEWERKLHVLRYLAASYFRLGRYDEAMGELLDCIETWPREIALREQLAKVYSAAGRETEATQVWESVLELDPSNRMARKALKLRDTRPPMNTPYPVSAPHESDDGLDLRPVSMCTRCGAQNSAEFERCWQCGAGLHEANTPPAALLVEPEPMMLSRLTGRVATVLFVALLAGAVFVTARYVPGAFDTSPTVDPPQTMAEIFLRELTPARLTLWFAAFLAVTVMLSVAAKVLRLKDAGARFTLGLSMAVATAMYLCTWLPVPYLVAAFAGVALLVFPITIWMAGAGLWKGLAAALFVLTAAVGAAIGVGWAYFGVSIFQEREAIAAFVARHDAQVSPGVHPAQELAARADFTIEWSSTGSPWLDSLANEAGITMVSQPIDPPLRLELYVNDDMEFVHLEEPASHLRIRVKAGVLYRAVLRGEEGVEAQMHITGVLTPTVTLEE